MFPWSYFSVFKAENNIIAKIIASILVFSKSLIL